MLKYLSKTPVSLTVNGEVWVTFMCTPANLEALSLGFIYNEGIVRAMNGVMDARICEHRFNVYSNAQRIGLSLKCWGCIELGQCNKMLFYFLNQNGKRGGYFG
jgi:formate dehydrogenase accessory protein FdhD